MESLTGDLQSIARDLDSWDKSWEASRVREAAQVISQIADNIELAEAEQRGFNNGFEFAMQEKSR